MASLKTLTQNVSNNVNSLTRSTSAATTSAATTSAATSSPISLSAASSSAKSTAKSVLEKLKNLSARSTQNIVLEETPMSEKLLGSADSNYWVYFRYGIIILILAFLGLNVFASLGLLTENLANFFRPVLVFLGYSVGETIRQTTDVSAEGSKAVIDATNVAIDSAVNVLERAIDQDKVSTDKALNNAQRKQKQRPRPIRDAPQPDESGSRTQSNSTNKSGYCYIGEDRGFRSCIKVDEQDECISGDIFPSKDICINPNLRA